MYDEPDTIVFEEHSPIGSGVVVLSARGPGFTVLAQLTFRYASGKRWHQDVCETFGALHTAVAYLQAMLSGPRAGIQSDQLREARLLRRRQISEEETGRAA